MPWFLSLRSPRAEWGMGLSSAVVLFPGGFRAVPGELWVAGFGSTRECMRLAQKGMSCLSLEVSVKGLVVLSGMRQRGDM